MMKSLIIYLPCLIHLLLFILTYLLILNIMNHPISLMVIILSYSMMICLNMSLWKSNYILSIFLFLMMISGLLIIFLYFSSLISNDQFKLKINYILLTLLLFNYIFISYFMNLKNLYIYKYKFYEISPITLSLKPLFNNILNIYEYPSYNLTLMCMFYLLFSLFSIIKITSSNPTTLRKIN